MADDIYAIDSGVPTSDGSAVVFSPGDYGQTLATDHKPGLNINDIRDKYGDRFDDPTYYTEGTG